ncbi:MAG: ABC transporter ATP-binding protein [Actinomycetota bacterium]|nr:ABC transporter ATP-binding protein [Actinomycetota bacterium]
MADFLTSSKGRISVGLIFASINALITWLTPWPLKIVVDSVFGRSKAPSIFGAIGSKHELLYIIAASMALLALLGGVATYLSALAFTNAGMAFTNDLQIRVFNHLLMQPPSFFQSRKQGDLNTRLIADVQSIQRAMVDSIPTLVNSTLSILGILVILGFLGPMYLLSVAALGVFIVFDLTYFMKKVKAESRRARDYEGQANSVAQQAISGLVVVQTSNGEGAERSRFSNFIKASTSHSMKSNMHQAAMNASVTTTLNLTIAAFVLFGGVAVFSKSLSVGMILVVTSYARSIYKPLQQLTKRAGIVGAGLAARERVVELLVADESVVTFPKELCLDYVDGDIEFRGVSLAYSDRTIAEDLNFKVPMGAKIAIVGETGAGKSTIAKMIPRLIEPTTGDLYIGGVNVKDLDLVQLRSHVSYLPQETFIFAGTIWENIAYGSRGAGRLDAIKAAAEAGVIDIIKALPLGFDTVVAEKGSSLSGGQRQCVAIARAVLKNSSIIIFDEPTVGIDPSLEAVISSALESASRGRTTIVITHQEATARLCDVMYRLVDGHIVTQSHGSYFNVEDPEGFGVSLIRR